MGLNSDFDQRIAQSARDAVWTPSPLPGVGRRMLERVGGEEILVPDGVFRGEDGDYPN